MRIGQLFPPAAPTPCRPSARPPPALLPRDAAAPRRGECRRAPPRRPNRQAAPSGPARIPSPEHRGRNPGRARTLRKPMRWACSRKHWRHMKMWYFRMRPVWLEHTRLHIQAERRAEPGQSGKRTTSAAGGWAGAPLAAALGRLGVVGEDEVRHNGRCRPADLPPSACAAVQSPGVG